MLSNNTELESPETTLRARICSALNEYFKRVKNNKNAEFPNGTEIRNIFFRHWYTSWAFVFRKNIKVTNIQLPELLHLISLHSVSSTSASFRLRDGSARVYEKSKFMKELFSELWNALPQPDQNGLSTKDPAIIKFIDTFSTRYAGLFCETLLVDAFCGTCIVCIPPTLSMNLARICAESGYIYSCGRTLYMRRSNKVREDVLREKIVSWLSENTDTMDRVPFVVYSQELFPISSNPDTQRAELNGLSDLKFHLDKFYFGTTPVSDLYNELVEPQSETIPQSQKNMLRRLRPVLESHDSFLRPQASQRPDLPSIWLYVDKPVRLGEPMQPGSRYFLCMVQQFRNTSHTYELDEYKPGWTQSVTLPHTLTAAMLNVARGSMTYAPDEPLAVLDPFMGCGTTAIEALKLGPHVSVRGTDVYWLNEIATKDNIEFLRAGPNEWQRIVDELTALVSPLLQNQQAEQRGHAQQAHSALFGLDAAAIKKFDEEDWKSLHNKFKAAYAIAGDVFLKAKDRATKQEWSFSAFKSVGSVEVDEKYKALLQQIGVDGRILFYIFWKALISNVYAFFSDPKGDAASLREKAAVDGLKAFIERCRRLVHTEQSTEISANEAGLILKQGLHSPKIYCKFQATDKQVEYEIRNILDLEVVAGGWISPRSIDVVITDPPYGFNVQQPELELNLPDLYIKLIEIVLGAVRSGGQIIFCVPSRPMNGQVIPYYMTSAFVIKQFLLKARESGRQLRTPVVNWPDPEVAFKAPYYWESERALRRAILHFQVFDEAS